MKKLTLALFTTALFGCNDSNNSPQFPESENPIEAHPELPIEKELLPQLPIQGIPDNELPPVWIPPTEPLPPIECYQSVIPKWCPTEDTPILPAPLNSAYGSKDGLGFGMRDLGGKPYELFYYSSSFSRSNSNTHINQLFFAGQEACNRRFEAASECHGLVIKGEIRLNPDQTRLDFISREFDSGQTQFTHHYGPQGDIGLPLNIKTTEVTGKQRELQHTDIALDDSFSPLGFWRRKELPAQFDQLALFSKIDEDNIQVNIGAHLPSDLSVRLKSDVFAPDSNVTLSKIHQDRYKKIWAVEYHQDDSSSPNTTEQAYVILTTDQFTGEPKLISGSFTLVEFSNGHSYMKHTFVSEFTK